MRLIDSFWLGRTIGILDTAVLARFVVKLDDFRDVIEVMREFLKDLKEFELTKRSHSEIQDEINNLEKYEKNIKLNLKDKERLYEKFAIWKDRISNEIRSKFTVLLNRKGKVNYTGLIEGRISSFFSKEDWERLSKIAKSDLFDASRCLLVRLWTPAAMIALRATEDVLRQFYLYKTENESSNKSWKEILNELSPLVADKTLIGHLDFIRNKRNKAEHPDKIFSQSEAENIFNIIIMTIEELFELMPIS